MLKATNRFIQEKRENKMRKKPKLELTANQRCYIERELLRVTSIAKVARSSHVPQKLVKFVKQELIKNKKLTGNEIRQSIKNKSNEFQKKNVKSTPVKSVEKQKDLRQKRSGDTAKTLTFLLRKDQNLERKFPYLSGKKDINEQELKISTLAQIEGLKYKYKRQKLKTYRNKIKLALKTIDLSEKEVNLEKRKVELERKEVDLERKEVNLERREVEFKKRTADLEKRELELERKDLELIMKEQRIEEMDQRSERIEQRQKRNYLDSSYIHKQKLLHDKESVGVEAKNYMSITDLKKRGYEFMSNKKVLHDQTESVIKSRQDDGNVH